MTHLEHFFSGLIKVIKYKRTFSQDFEKTTYNIILYFYRVYPDAYLAGKISCIFQFSLAYNETVKPIHKLQENSMCTLMLLTSHGLRVLYTVPELFNMLGILY